MTQKKERHARGVGLKNVVMNLQNPGLRPLVVTEDARELRETKS